MSYSVNLQYTPPGTKILQSNKANSEYQILELIGQGSEGNVYRGKFLHQDNVAIKLQSSLKQSDILQKFTTIEFQNLINVREIISNQEGVYVVMDYADGEFYKYMQQNEYKQKSVREKVELFLQIVKGVDELHKQNMIHRDLKPENVLFFKKQSGELQLKLCDFGLIKLKPQNNFQTANIGTPYYWAPELISNGLSASYTEKVDIWALGMILIEMFTGKPLLYWITTVEGIKNYYKQVNQETINETVLKSFQFKEFEKQEKQIKQILIQKLLVIDQHQRINSQQLVLELQQVLANFQPIIFNQFTGIPNHINKNNYLFPQNNQNLVPFPQGNFQLAPKFPQQLFSNSINQREQKFPLSQNQKNQIQQEKLNPPIQQQFFTQFKAQQQQDFQQPPPISQAFRINQIQQNKVVNINNNQEETIQNSNESQNIFQNDKQLSMQDTTDERVSTYIQNTKQLNCELQLQEKENLIKNQEIELINLKTEKQKLEEINEKIKTQIKIILKIFEQNQNDQTNTKFIESLISQCESLKQLESNSEFQQDIEKVNLFFQQQLIEFRKLELTIKENKTEYENSLNQNQFVKCGEFDQKLKTENESLKKQLQDQSLQLKQSESKINSLNYCVIKLQNEKDNEIKLIQETNNKHIYNLKLEKLNIINLLNDITGQILQQILQNLKRNQKKVDRITEDDKADYNQFKDKVINVQNQIQQYTEELQSYKLKTQTLNKERNIQLIIEQQILSQKLILNVMKTLSESQEEINNQKKIIKVFLQRQHKQMQQQLDIANQNLFEQNSKKLTDLCSEIQNPLNQLIFDIGRLYKYETFCQQGHIDQIMMQALNLFKEFEKDTALVEQMKESLNVQEFQKEVNRLKQKFWNHFKPINDQQQIFYSVASRCPDNSGNQQVVGKQILVLFQNSQVNYQDLAKSIIELIYILKSSQPKQRNNYASIKWNELVNTKKSQEFNEIMNHLQNLTKKYQEIFSSEKQESIVQKIVNLLQAKMPQNNDNQNIQLKII